MWRSNARSCTRRWRSFSAQWSVLCCLCCSVRYSVCYSVFCSVCCRVCYSVSCSVCYRCRPILAPWCARSERERGTEREKDRTCAQDSFPQKRPTFLQNLLRKAVLSLMVNIDTSLCRCVRMCVDELYVYMHVHVHVHAR